jgi:purine-binding chemotaxis protein CheW
MANELQYCTFTIDKMYFGVDVQQVQEVIRFLEMTRVPLARPDIRGLINLRGQIVTAINLRERLGMPVNADAPPPMNVVVRLSGGVASLLVDEIGDVVNVEGADFERPPETLVGSLRELITGVYKLKDRLLLILDIERAVSIEAAA